MKMPGHAILSEKVVQRRISRDQELCFGAACSFLDSDRVFGDWIWSRGCITS
ncbi:hypothetical protein GCWU000341_01531 [Oribacterium sp. oral taxon 078 str. F0262]|nr:hypothetical protein GCWU000341_01531 [Oribacterium sp. oral taxon 078 str. F0262]